MGDRNDGWPRLTGLGFWLRLGVSLLVIAVLGGYAVSGVHLRWHYENRDQRAGLTFKDIEGAYAGAVSPSPMLASIEDGHPDGIAPADRDALIAWLKSDSVAADFDNFDLGEAMPEDLLYVNCVSCHGRDASGEDAIPTMPLERWADVEPLALSTTMVPKDMKIVVASMHAHLPMMAMVLLVLALLCAMTRWAKPVSGLVICAGVIGLLADFAGQALAQTVSPLWTYAIVGGGVAYGASATIAGLLVVLDCWLPGGRSASPPEEG